MLRSTISSLKNSSTVRGSTTRIHRVATESPPVMLTTTATLRSHTITTLTNNYNYHSQILKLKKNPSSSTSNRINVVRSLSSKTNENAKKDGSTGEETSNEIVLTPGEKLVAGTRLTMWAGIFAFASVCAYYIGKELIPTKMSPNTVFDKAFNVIRENQEINDRFGGPLKAYGRDHGGKREGRRNFIEHTEYESQDDGSKRTRVRFNLEGQFGNAFVFAEVSSEMPSGEFVYIIVQDKRNGQVFTLVDNRSAIMSKKFAGANKEGAQAMQNLLTGGRN